MTNLKPAELISPLGLCVYEHSLKLWKLGDAKRGDRVTEADKDQA